MRVLVLGVTGMLGSAVWRVFEESSEHCAWGTLRSSGGVRHFPVSARERLLSGIDVLNHDALAAAFAQARPEVVINCVGLIKQRWEADDPLLTLPVNSMLPHRLVRLCMVAGARLIHVSTDCVYSGRKGLYREEDISDAEDLYGKSKFIGELHDMPNAITLRTSIIGHELESSHALVDWFLSQEGEVLGFSRAVFSGLPTVELARVMRDYVLPRPQLRGLYHVSAQPISKLELLKFVARAYDKAIRIHPDDRVVIDRSLDSRRFTEATGYVAPDWPELVARMRQSSGMWRDC